MNKLNNYFIYFLLLLSFIIMSCSTKTAKKEEIPSNEVPPVFREFRAVWVATVDNIDWPSKPGLPVDLQKYEVITILDTIQKLNFNAVVLQVRPQCDALYESKYEPWSYYLTGAQGKVPEPFYDPLEFWITEAHKRGIELHAWFNPYRAHHPQGGEVSEFSVVKTHPELVKELNGGYYWLDPAKQETQDYSFNVVMDVVKRYNIDGVHLDDYFYPYPSYYDNQDFPDNDTWDKYLTDGGKLTRNDWRRDAVNKFIVRLYNGIKSEKRSVKFGISPFGIWRPHNPPSIEGFDQYDMLYADAKLWLNEGWIDYFTPQLYWPINQMPQSYPVLLGWWELENLKGRHLWPGLYMSRYNNDTGVDELINQVMITRGFISDNPGNVHFSMRALLNDSSGLGTTIINGPYKTQALVPAFPWLDNAPPSPPKINIKAIGDSLKISWAHANENDVFVSVVYFKYDTRWRYIILNNRHSDITLPLSKQINSTNRDTNVEKILELKKVTVSAVDRLGNESDKEIIDI